MKSTVQKRRTATGIISWLIVFIVAAASLFAGARAETAGRPNVIVILTDDQGYGDMGCTGNPWLKTPNLDQMYAESVRLQNFHADPVCTPSRAALMTGRYSVRVGAWAVTEGRQLLRRDETTMAEVFASNGYRTGIFGKWHLGDNYPYAPQYRGFQESLVIGGGSIGEIPDAWGNDYFDDRYRHNGKLAQYHGYCTDVFFSAAMDFIRQNKDRAFMLYLPCNAMHDPRIVAKQYSEPYRQMGVPEPRANFFGMIANFDENLGRLRAALREWHLDDNTIVIFFGDNGTSVGGGNREGDGYNAGMRGHKGSVYEGGHRMAGLIRWPGQLQAGRDVAQLTAHRDLLPTLIDLCQLKPPAQVSFDGSSIVPLLKGRTEEWPDRYFVVDRQGDHLKKWADFAVMSERWRLVNNELYDLPNDPGQRKNVAADHPEVVRELRADYEKWWSSVSRRGEEYCSFLIGSPEENPTVLTARDWHPTESKVIWRQATLADDNVFCNGFWMIDVSRSGRYAFKLSRYPDEINGPCGASEARLKIGAAVLTQTLNATDAYANFEVDLPAGQQALQTWMKDAATGKERGAYYVTATRLKKN